MKLGIGIDTGGTYTDAVIYDFDSKKVLATAKSLTTKYDLKIGILGAIDGLPGELSRAARVVSLSTTLATNACVEDKGGRAKLIFFGADKATIEKYGKKFGLPEASEIFIQETENWEEFEKQTENGYNDLDGIGIIEMNSSQNGAAREKKAKAILENKLNKPIVCGHELFSELNCLRRGAGTLLNAGLIPVIAEFLSAVKKALELRSIKPETLVVVRSDGSLMSEEFASLHPVETLLCGPAASAIGCASLVNEENCMVVDMGGTTTDIAFINQGLPKIATGGVSIGKWKTFVNGLYVKTLGLGGDSAVHYRGENLILEEYRVIPLCVGAKKFPVILENLKNTQPRKHTKYLYEHLVLIKDIEESPRYSEEEKALCRALKEKPLMFSLAALAVGKDIYTFNCDSLIKDGVVAVCGLTPTDIMHIKGDFVKFEKEASLLGARFVAFNLGVSVEELCEKVYEEVKRKLYLNIVCALLENKYPHYMKNGVNEDIVRFINDNFYEALNGDSLFSSAFKTKYSLVGSGAPIGIFLGDVAKMLGTKAIFPENCSVANAVGAVCGSVSASFTVEIKEGEESPFTVYAPNGKVDFEELEAAVEFAKKEALNEAEKKAVSRGAKGEIALSVEVQNLEGKAQDIAVYLGTKVVARAVGSMGF